MTTFNIIIENNNGVMNNKTKTFLDYCVWAGLVNFQMEF